MKPYPAYKDSGVEWIGEIPIKWSLGKLRYFCAKITDGSHSSPATADDGYPYITVSDIKGDMIEFDKCKKITKADFLLLVKNGCKPNKNDLLLTKDGTIGKAIIVRDNFDFVILSSLGLITPDFSKMSSRFLKYYLISGKNIDQMFSLIHGSALTRLTIKKIKELITISPPLSPAT